VFTTLRYINVHLLTYLLTYFCLYRLQYFNLLYTANKFHRKYTLLEEKKHYILQLNGISSPAPAKPETGHFSQIRTNPTPLKFLGEFGTYQCSCSMFSQLRKKTTQPNCYSDNKNNKPVSELRDVTCHMISHNVTCHLTQVNPLRPTPAHRLVLNLPTLEGWKAELT